METGISITSRSVTVLSASQCCSETSDYLTIVYRRINADGNALL
jgi:hypothetical protein